MPRVIVCLVALTTGTCAAADNAVRPILDLHKANNLFDKTEYKALY